MCNLYAGQDPSLYTQVNRSLRLAGYATSIRLEGAFWAILDDIAASQELSTPKFLSLLYDEAVAINGEMKNFASMLRTTCVLHLGGARPSAEELAALASKAAA